MAEVRFTPTPGTNGVRFTPTKKAAPTPAYTGQVSDRMSGPPSPGLVDLLDSLWEAGGTKPDIPGAAQEAPALTRFGGSLADAVQSIGTAVRHPVDTARTMFGAPMQS